MARRTTFSSGNGLQFMSIGGSISGSTFTQVNSTGGTGVQILQMDGQNVIINGEEYEQVLSVTIETKTERKRLDANYKALHIDIKGDCTKPLKIDSGSVTVGGSCSEIKTSSGRVQVNGSCSGDIKTMSGSVNVGGVCQGNIKTMSGSVRHG